MNAHNIAITIIILYAGYKIDWSKLKKKVKDWCYYHEGFVQFFGITALVIGAFLGIFHGIDYHLEKKCLTWGEEHSLNPRYKSANTEAESCLVLYEGIWIQTKHYEEIVAIKAKEKE